MSKLGHRNNLQMNSASHLRALLFHPSHSHHGDLSERLTRKQNNPVISCLNSLLGLHSWQKSILTSWCDVQGVRGQPYNYLSRTLLPLAPQLLPDPVTSPPMHTCLKHYLSEYSYYWIYCVVASFNLRPAPRMHFLAIPLSTYFLFIPQT